MIKNPLANTGDPSLIPGSGRSPGEGDGNPLQHSCLENLMDRGAWWATVHGLAKSQTQLSDQTTTISSIYVSIPISPPPTPLLSPLVSMHFGCSS